MEKKKSLLPKLFWSTLYLSAFTFGGGYVIVTLMKEKFVDRYHWIEEDEMLDLVAIAQSSPGAIAGKRRHCRRIQAGRHSRRNHSQRRHDPSALFYHFPDFRFLHRFPGKFHCQPDALRYAGGRWRRHRLRCLGYGLRHNRREKHSIPAYHGQEPSLPPVFFNVNVVYVVIVCGLIGVSRTFLGKRKERK